MGKCVSVIWRVVPYHEARFNAAIQMGLDVTVIEVVGQNPVMRWSERERAQFPIIRPNERGWAGGARSRQRWLWQKLEELTPRIVAVQGWADWAALTTIGWALRRDAAIIVMSESNEHDRPRRAVVEWCKAKILKLCDAALVGGEKHAEYLERLGFPRERIAFGHNVVDNAHFALPRESAPIDDGFTSASYFLVVARLVPEKNIATIIRAYARYRSATKISPWRLVICGTGPEEASLRSLTRHFGLEDDVRFMGFCSYELLPAIYQHAGALVHLSTSEPWGLVVNEALAAGLPVIVSRCCGCCSELVRDGVNGFIVDPLDTERVAELMSALAEGRYDRSMLVEAGKQIIASFGPERFGEGLREAIRLADKARSKQTDGVGKLVASAVTMALLKMDRYQRNRL